MAAFADIDWTTASEEDQLRAVRRASPDELSQLLTSYDWSLFPETVLGWATAQKSVELCAAMVAFFNGDPMRFNYVPKADVPASHRGICRLLDAIAQRVNAGFYLPGPAPMPQPALGKLQAWMFYQQEDVSDRRRGRWVFDRDLLDPILNPDKDCDDAEPADLDADPAYSLGQMVKPLMNLRSDQA